MRDTTHMVFGRRGNAAQYLLGGWAHDNNRTWTIGHASHALLPCPRRRGTYLLRVAGSAFVADAVPFQRLVVLANGTEVGRFLLSDAFRIECVLPWSVLAGAASLALDFRHPDAVRPSDVGDSDDWRWIALGLTELRLSRAPTGTVATHRPPDGGDDDDSLPAPLRQRRPVGRGPQSIPYRRLGEDWLRRPIMEHFVEAVARHPERIAIDDGARTVSFAQVVQHAAEIAGQIAAATAPGECVAVCLDSSVWLPIAVLSCLTAGRSCAAIDPEDSATVAAAAALQPALQIVAAGSPPALADVPALVLTGTARPLQGLRVAAMQEAAFRFTAPRAPDGWVAVSEAAILLDLAHAIEASHLNDGDRHVSLAADSGLDALRTMLAALLTGGTLHLRDPFAADATPLPLLRRAAPTVCGAPLPVLLALARRPEAHAALRKLRLLRIEGGLLRWNEVAALRALLPEACHILYAYAPAETLTCIQHFVAMPTADTGTIVPAGFALHGFAARVAGPDGAALPDGTVGELVVEATLPGRTVSTGRMALRRTNGLFWFAPAVAVTPDDAVRAAWQAVLGAPPRAREVFGTAGGDSLKLIEFAMELENRLGGRLPMSLLTLQMDAAQIAAALVAPPDSTETLLAHELVQRFESLGGFCEFGFVQRACQVEPYSLLRFAGTKPPGLIAAIESRLEGFGAPETLTLSVKETNEYVVREGRFGFAFHTDIMVGQVAAEDMLAREARRLGFLAERMRADLAAARPIFIFRSHGPQEDGAMPALHAALRRHGPNRLLWVMAADAEHPIGSTRQMSDSLMTGYVDPLAVIDAGQTVLVDSWLQVCSDTYRAFAA